LTVFPVRSGKLTSHKWQGLLSLDQNKNPDNELEAFADHHTSWPRTHGNNFALGLLPDLGYPSMIHIMIGSINEGTNRHSHMNRLSFEKGRK
jgi:hypothetical protein